MVETSDGENIFLGGFWFWSLKLELGKVSNKNFFVFVLEKKIWKFLLEVFIERRGTAIGELVLRELGKRNF